MKSKIMGLALLLFGLACSSKEKQFIKMCEINNATVGVVSNSCDECLNRVVMDASKSMPEVDQVRFTFLQNTCPDHFTECAHEGQYSDCACVGRMEVMETDACQQHAVDLFKMVAPCKDICSQGSRDFK